MRVHAAHEWRALWPPPHRVAGILAGYSQEDWIERAQMEWEDATRDFGRTLYWDDETRRFVTSIDEMATS